MQCRERDKEEEREREREGERERWSHNLKLSHLLLFCNKIAIFQRTERV